MQEHTNFIEAFFIRLKSRNRLLFYSGWFFIAAALTCVVLINTTTVEVLGINAWIKPLKFFISIGILCWTMAWYLVYLRNQKAVKRYSWVLVAAMLFEMVIICWQAANGRMSHFNISTPLYAALFNAMGVVIATFTFWTAYICYLFFKQKEFPLQLPPGYITGIRLGILFFVVFAFEGGWMAARLSHTVGAPDGGPGYPLINWSNQYGDLRVAHFFGMHALQLLPLLGYYFFRSKGQIIWLSAAYFLFVVLLLWQAVSGHPLIPFND